MAHKVSQQALEKTTIGELLDLSPAVRRYLLARIPDI